MPLQNTFAYSRSTPLRVVLPPPLDKEIVLAPLTIKQTADSVLLDPKPNASASSGSANRPKSSWGRNTLI